MGVALDSMVAHGCIVSGGRVTHSILSPNVRINSYCEVEHSIVMLGVNVGRYSRVRRAILDVGVTLPESTTVGYHREADLARGYLVTESGITVVPAPEEAAVFAAS